MTAFGETSELACGQSIALSYRFNWFMVAKMVVQADPLGKVVFRDVFQADHLLLDVMA